MTVLVDGIPTGGVELRVDASNYYVFLAVPYGTHLVELQFTAPQPPYALYIAIGALSAGLIGVLFLVRRRKLQKNYPVSVPDLDSRTPPSTRPGIVRKLL